MATRRFSSVRCRCGFSGETPAEAGSWAAPGTCGPARGHLSAVPWGERRVKPPTPAPDTPHARWCSGMQRRLPPQPAVALGCLRCISRITGARAAPSPDTACSPLEPLTGRFHPARAPAWTRAQLCPSVRGSAPAWPAPRLAPSAHVLYRLVLL